MQTRTKFSLTAYSLKIIALLFMILDHVHSYFNVGPSWIGVTTRFVAPLFVYFLVEGFYYTRNRKKYALRLTFIALLMMVVNVAINFFFKSVDPFTGEMTYFSLMQGNNIFQTLALFMYIMMLLENMKKVSLPKKVIHGGLIILISLYAAALSEGGLYLLPILFICYFSFNNKKRVCLGIIIWSLILLAKALFNYMSLDTGMSLLGTLSYDSQWAMIFTVIPIQLYNGQRGKTTTFSKWLFYIIYPFHIWLFMILSYIFIR